MRGSRILFVLVAVLLSLVARPPASSSAPARDHAITPEDYFTIDTAIGCVVSPDGSRAAFPEMRWDKTLDKRNTDLWVVDMATGKIVRLTFDPASDRSPEWSRDGQWIYFLSARKGEKTEDPPYNGKSQVWRVAPSGGEVFAITRLKDGVDSFRLSSDGTALYYTTSRDNPPDDNWKSLRAEFGDLRYGHDGARSSILWKLDLATWRTKKLVDEGRVINTFSVSPDERRVAMVTRPDEALITNEGWSHLDIYDAATGEVASLADRQWREEAPSPYGWLLGPTWSDDGMLAFRVDFDGYPGEVFFVRFVDGAAPSIHKMVRPGEVSVEGDMRWRPKSRAFCFAAEDHARSRVIEVSVGTDGSSGKSRVLTPGDLSVDDFSFSRNGKTLVILTSGLDHPPDLFRVRNPGPGAKLDRLTRLNPQVDTWKLPQISLVQWTSTDGTPVEGILELPPDYNGGDPLPLVVELHGGPTASTLYRLRFWIYGRTIFAARGWALLSPNYRGSTGYGDKFLTDLIGNENNRDVADILSGVDAMIDRGIADPKRMAVMGWSNGGYLTDAVITHDQRFRAASSGAGVFDKVVQWCLEDTPGHVINYAGGPPWKTMDRMREASPILHVDKVTTPTLIHVGANDPRVPPGNSRGLYRALHDYLHVPTELIVYPGARHGLTKYTHRKAKLKWDIQWFDHYVLGKTEKTEAP